MAPAGVELTVIGAGPAYSDRPGAIGACYLVEADGAGIALDLGHGAFGALAALREPSDLAAVVVSHLHPDHFIDLVPLRHYLRWEFDPTRRVTVHAPSGIDRRLDLLHDAPGFTRSSLDVEPLEEGVRRIGPFALEARLVPHTEESYAFRLSRVAAGVDSPGLVYSGDCGDASMLAPLVRPGDTLLVEASFGPGPVEPGAAHLDGPTIAELARHVRPSRVLLTHILDWRRADETVASVRARYDGEVRVVWPGDRCSL